MKHQAVSSRY